MDKDKIIDGLRVTMEQIVFDPSTGKEYSTDILNDLDRKIYDACKGALEILERLDTDSDTISKAKAIEALRQQAETMSEWSNRYAEQRKGVLTAVNIVEDLPPIQPKRERRKIGEWIYDWGDWDFETCKCSECGNHMTTPIGKRYSFCPNCGADMREVTT